MPTCIDPHPLVRPGAPGVPEASVLACLRHAVDALLADFVPLAVMGSISVAVLALGAELADVWEPAGVAAGLLLAIPLAWGFDAVCLRAVRGRPVSGRHLRRVLERYPDVVITAGLVGILVVAGLLLLVVPGVILFCRLRFVPYLLLDAELSPGEAVRGSLELTRGSTLRILALTALGLLLFVAGLPFLGVGGLLGGTVGALAMAAFYHATVEPG